MLDRNCDFASFAACAATAIGFWSATASTSRLDKDVYKRQAISAVFELVKFSNTTASENSSKAYLSWLKETIEKLCDVLGIITEKKEEILDSEIEDMIAQRQQARKDKNFALADEIRGKLLEMGIVLEDTREGVKWKRA